MPRSETIWTGLTAEPVGLTAFGLYTDSTRRTNGLVGSYINTSLRYSAGQADWRVTQTIAGRRVDTSIRFTSNGWGTRSVVGLTGGTDTDWENFSVQWDGYLEVLQPGTRLATKSDDGSRMWIDLNNDGLFTNSGPEFIDNHWGTGQAATMGPISQPVPVGLYRIRVQYEEGNGANVMSLLANPPGPVSKPTVRVAYVIPLNRTPQNRVVFKLQRAMLTFQNWYREQMERNGFGSKTFALDTGEGGVTPKIHIVPVPETDDYLRGDVWGRTIRAVSAAGVPVWEVNQVWFIVPECHAQGPDGSISGGMAGGASYGSGSDPGVGMLGSDGLARFDVLTDDRPYAGLIIPEVGPFPLVQDRSFPWFEGRTLSSAASSVVGAALHELSHGFGLSHIARNDENFHGNLMGNGLRGIRGYLYPNLYPGDYTRLSYPSALALNVSRYFNADTAFTDNTRPSLAVSTSGVVPLTNGQVRIAFSATDGGGLAAAILGDEGGMLEAMPLSGTTTNAVFFTPVFTPGQSNHFYVTVLDRQGNRQQVETFVMPPAGVNRAPQPFIKFFPPTPTVEEDMILSAENSSDPDHSTSLLRVEWDLDGNGQFDTAPTTAKRLETNFIPAGVRLIRARLTDPSGGTALTVPVALRSVVYDATAPSMAVAAPADLAYSLTNAVVLIGSASDNSGILWLTVNGHLAATTNAFTNWVCRIGPLAAGTNEITVCVSDKAAPPNLSSNVHRVIYAAGAFDGDGDGLPDAWELSWFIEVQSPHSRADADPDGDSFTNIQEYYAGTNPTNAASVLRMEAMTWSDTDVRLRFRTVAGKRYRIESSSTLPTTGWTVLTTNLSGDGSIVEWVDASAVSPRQQFYRVRLDP